ncbi:MAG: hypothetical protein ACLFV7_12005 [Phycisphaerae bacterium]
MIIDLERFLKQERPRWAELQTMLDQLESRDQETLDLSSARRLHYLYERAGSDLGKLRTAGGEPELCRYLETIIARAYTLIHGRARRRRRLRPLHWLGRTFPRAVRRRWRAGALSVSIMLAGVLLGVIALRVDPTAKEELLPYGHGQMDPADRVAEEEQTGGAEIRGQETEFRCT